MAFTEEQQRDEDTVKKWLEVSVRGDAIGLPLLASAGYSRLLAVSSHGAHDHPTYELFAALSGDLVLEQGPRIRLHMRGGSLLVIRPGVAHRPADRQLKPGKYLWLQIAANPVTLSGSSFVPADYRQLIARLDRHAGVVRPAGRQLMAQLTSCKRLLDRFTAGRTPTVTPTLLRMVTCLTVLRFAEHLDEAMSHGDNAGVGPIMQAACAYMAAHYTEELSLRRIADHLGYDVSWFEKRFRAEVGVPPGNYLQSLRVEKAKELLGTGRAGITDAALSTGFTSSQYFAHVFRKFTGQSPSEYRLSAHNAGGLAAGDANRGKR
jgi:AraC-like DNA-binding protein